MKNIVNDVHLIQIPPLTLLMLDCVEHSVDVFQLLLVVLLSLQGLQGKTLILRAMAPER
jgi:hypothetical protein